MTIKGLAGNLALTLFSLLLLEVGTFLCFPLITGKSYSRGEMLAKQRSGVVKLEQNVVKQTAQLFSSVHPYLGFAYDNDLNVPKHDGIGVNDYGFLDDKTPLQKRTPDKLIVGYFGGSVAWWASKLGADTLEEELKKDSRFSNKEIVIVRLALGGFKQPQQLMALSYLMALGAEFDIVINLDGYNEVALPFTYNFVMGITPSYPTFWMEHVNHIIEPRTQKLIGQLAYFEEQRADIASFMARSTFHNSVTLNALWSLSDQIFDSRLNDIRGKIAESKPKHQPHMISGPEYSVTDNNRRAADLAAVWQNSSSAMNALCLAHGIQYFHFLQPNQYVPNSKNFTEDEKKLAYIPESPGRYPVEVGYPYLEKAGVELVKSHVKFHDLTMLFKDFTGDAYQDSCCHINLEGNIILTKEIARIITGSW